MEQVSQSSKVDLQRWSKYIPAMSVISSMEERIDPDRAGPKWLTSKIRVIIVVALPFLVYLAGSMKLRNWLIDDAGISFAYARSFAMGAGLVSQPGMPPVEGYSNFLWILILAPFFKLGVFEPYLVPKILSIVLVGITFVLLQRSISQISESSFIAPLVALSLLATNASFVVWTSSGLENALYAALTALLLYFLLQAVARNTITDSKSLSIGAISGLIALTRPDGALFILAFPLITLVTHVLPQRTLNRSLIRNLVFYGVAVASVYGSYLLFRLMYFGEIHPNTYFAKGGLHPYLSSLKLFLNNLVGANSGAPLGLIVIALIANAHFNKGVRHRLRIALWHMTFLALLPLMLLPADWMGEFRFATALITLLIPALIIEGTLLFRRLHMSSMKRGVFMAVLIISLFALYGPEHSRRLDAFSKNPTVPLERIAKQFSERFDRYALTLGLENASFLTPDLGGTLYYSRLRIYDLAGLCDRTVAKTLGKNQGAFYDYIFDEIKPTFIHTHGFFTSICEFDLDQRFSRDYVAIRDYDDAYAEKRIKRPIKSGDFVRRDAIADRMEVYQELVATENPK